MLQIVVVNTVTVPLVVYVIVWTVDDGVGSVVLVTPVVPAVAVQSLSPQLVTVKVVETPLEVYVIVLTVAEGVGSVVSVVVLTVAVAAEEVSV